MHASEERRKGGREDACGSLLALAFIFGSPCFSRHAWASRGTLVFLPLFGDAPSLPPPLRPARPYAHVQEKQQQQKSLGTDPSPGAVTDVAAVRGAAEGPGPVMDVSVRVA